MQGSCPPSRRPPPAKGRWSKSSVGVGEALFIWNIKSVWFAHKNHDRVVVTLFNI